jgi:tetratricopeptide (TPR) repeat protein
MQFRINWRFLLLMSAASAVCLVAVHFAHGWQVRRQAGAFLHQADVARDASPPDAEREIAYLRRYLMARPAETDVRERLGRAMCKHAKKGGEILEAYLVVQDTLRRDPARDNLRRFAIDFAMPIGMHAEALSDIEVLLARRPNDGELEGLKAKCLVAAKKYKESEEWYRRAVEHRPDLVEAYPGYAAVLRLELKKGEDADQVVARMLKANPRNFRAQLLVAEYWRSFWGLGQNAVAAAKAVAAEQKLPPEARVSDAIARATAEAQTLAPDELGVVLAVADVARFRSYELARAAKPDEAKAAFAESYRILKAGLAKHPKAPALYLAMAALEAETKQEKEPVAVVRDGIAAIPDEPGLVAALLDYQIRAGEAKGAQETLDGLKAKGLPAAQAELQQGRILMLRGEWVEASLTLDHVRKTSPDNAALARQANLFLGRCYEQLGVLDRRLDAFKQAVPGDTTDSLWVPAQLGVAEAQAALGMTDEALNAYRLLQTRGLAVAWLQVARIELVKALQTPADKKPDWTATEDAVKAAEAVLPKDAEVRILRATLLSLQGKGGEARKRLESLKAERPKDAAVWVALAAQDQRDGNPYAALATLAAAEAAAGDSPAIRLARARLWVETKEPELERKLEGLAGNAEKLTPAQQRSLARGLAELSAAIPGPLGAKLWDRVAALQPHDVGAQLVRFDLELVSKDDVEVKDRKLREVLGEVRRIVGEAGGSTRLAKAIYLIWRAQNKKEMAGLDEAAALLDGLERERATWARVAFAQGLVSDLRGDARSALARYQKAVEYGESSPAALRRLMELLRAAGKFEEAAAILQKLPKASVADGDVQRVAAEVSLRTNNPSQAEAYADKAVSDKSTDPAEFIWQGQIYYGVGAKAKAEASFRKATALRPESPDGWLVLIQYLTLSKRGGEAEKVLGEAKEKVAKAERALFLGSAYSLLGREKIPLAEEAFKQARAERPADLRTLRTEAEFLFQVKGDTRAAAEAFRRVIGIQSASDGDREFARYMIGVCLAANRDYATSRSALEELGLLEGGRLRAPSANETATQKRGRIVVLALQRDRASKLEAIRLLEADPEITPNDQFLLAQLHQSVGNRNQVRVVMSGLLKKNDRVAVYVRYFAAWLLRAGDHAGAEEWVKRLTELQPDALPTAELRARLAAAKGNLTQARSIIVPRADAADAPVLAIAQVCEAIKLHDDAEALYKRAVEKAKEKQPQAPLVLAAYYGRRGRTSEALRICDEVRKSAPAPVVGGVAVEALYETPAPRDADVSHVAGWLDEAAQKATGEAKAALVQLLASVRNLQGDYAASMKFYRDAVAANPRDVLAMNNLAFLISAKELRHDEALVVLREAKKVRGPLPELLDTEALVLLHKKQPDAARQLLDQVTAQNPSATAFFHLAQAELAAGRKLEARRAWQQAEELGIKPADLHPLERPEVQRVSNVLK